MDDSTDLGLQRLFRPPFDHLPVEEQLSHYHQRDLMPTHVFRVGMKIFGKKPPIRRRVIEGSYGKSIQHSLHRDRQKITKDKDKEEKTQDDQQQEYKTWLEQRKKLREGLESIGAHEQWLTSKKCTPIEAKLLAKLKEERRLRNKPKSPPPPSESSGSEEEELTLAELRRIKLRERRHFLKDIKLLEKFLKLCRARIAEFVVPSDINRDYLVPTEVLVDYIERLKPPVTIQVIETLCKALEDEETELIDYRKLFQAGLENVVEKYLQELDKREDEEREKGMVDTDKEKSNGEVLQVTSSHVSGVFSTMDGEIGEIVKEAKEIALKQFKALIKYCETHNIVLSRTLAEKALLTPLDKARKQCLQHLRQAGTDSLSRKLVQAPKETYDYDEQDITSMYGWQYKIIRGPLQSRLMRLSTGTVRVKAKTDCWLTFEDFLQLTKEIRARPDFNYKYHGLPPDSAFWPGALLDKLRLYLPQETLATKSQTVYNIFQPVQPKACNPEGPLPTTKGVIWPENESGHVQLGSTLARTRKTYII